MTNRIFYLPLFLLLSFMSCKTETEVKQANTANTKNAEIDSLGNRYLELNRFSGVILIAKGDSVIYKNSFGLADYERSSPFSENTSFKIGEISEVVTAGIVRKLAKQGKFRLSDSISLFIPEIEANFTVNDLLNHNTNLPEIRLLKEQNPEQKYSIIEYARLALNSPLTSQNSELEYNLLGLLIERVSGRSYEENVQVYATESGLQDTYFQMADSSLAAGYLYHNYRGNGPELQESPDLNPDISFSSRGLKSTANDLVKIIRSAPKQPVRIEGYIQDDGFSYSAENDPQTGNTIIVLSNRRHPVAGEISNSINAILSGKDYRLPLPRKPFDIDRELLKEYPGFYSLSAGMSIEVLDNNDSLFVMMGPNMMHLIPQSPNQFYMAEGDAALRFLRDSTNKVNAVELLDGFLEGNKIMREK